MSQWLIEKSGLIALNKPAGISVIPGRNSTGPCLQEVWQKNLGRKLWVVHRLDRDTTGVLLFATDEKTHREASLAFENGQVKKTYLAWVEGNVSAPFQVDAALVPARRSRMRVARPGEEGKPALTLFSPKEAFERFSLVEARPQTGRTHQIRVHLKSAGHPLMFDHQYGRSESWTASMLGGASEEVLLQRTPLHAAEIELPALEIKVSAPMPEDMENVLNLLRR